jgi:hypothetical protein
MCPALGRPAQWHGRKKYRSAWPVSLQVNLSTLITSVAGLSIAAVLKVSIGQGTVDRNQVTLSFA